MRYRSDLNATPASFKEKRLLLYSRTTSVMIVRRRESQTKTNTLVESKPGIMAEICFPEAVHITVPPLLAPALHPHLPLR